MAGTLRLLALIAFLLAIVAAIPAPGPAKLGRVPWVPIGLALWVWAELAEPGGLDLDLD